MSAGQHTAPCNTPLARTKGPSSACAPSYQPSPVEPTGWRHRGSSPTPCPLGAPGMEGHPCPLLRAGGGAARLGLSRLHHPLGELGQVIRLGRAPETGDSISRHSETPHPGSLAGSRLRVSSGWCLPHRHRAGGAPGWHDTQGSQGAPSLTRALMSCSLRRVLQVPGAGAHTNSLPAPRHLPAAPRCTYRPSLEAGAQHQLPAVGSLACPLSVALAAAPAAVRFNPPSEQAGQRAETPRET